MRDLLYKAYQQLQELIINYEADAIDVSEAMYKDALQLSKEIRNKLKI